MGGTHYYENYVAPGRIFYRWPGAVFYTIYAYPTTEENKMTNGGCVRGIVAAAVGTTLAIIPPTLLISATALTVYNIVDSIVSEKGCYGGGSGSWYTIRGGPRTKPDGTIVVDPLSFTKSVRDEIWVRGEFTHESNNNYYTIERTNLPAPPRNEKGLVRTLPDNAELPPPK
eukprot:NODE_8278_length_693_cov_61.487719_g7656_i0.p1 GENE.NODE_8278_length_693_cov_61.487719_g7656_i0~~NODE_8278_length_693_cov_61.487719_g7656_i0.p1  ORF type:complete len:192 (+),score=39.11 NODE_8278_length_693_cov_61.487719_g7656_i0:66-578(+)